MPGRSKALKKMLREGYPADELDRVPANVDISSFDIAAFYVSIISHLVDVGIDVNIAVRYYLKGEIAAFWWTIGFILFPAFVNTAVTIKMYSQESDMNESYSKKMTKQKLLRLFVLVFQMAPILRYVDALRYALKSRSAGQRGELGEQRRWYALMLKEDSEAALLRAFECFLEAAPQQVLQLSLMIEGREEFKFHQTLSVVSSVVSMGWCLAAYQRATRFAKEDKDNMSWAGSLAQLLWHFLVTVSRIMSIAVVAYLYPYWTLLACALHTLAMAAWLQFFEKSPFCSDFLYGITFSLIMGLVYIFTYIMPVEGKTRYRYALYYSICFIEDIICTWLWFTFANETIRNSSFFNPIIIVSIVPYMLGLLCMVLYYQCLHPRLGVLVKQRRICASTLEFHEPVRETNLTA